MLVVVSRAGARPEVRVILQQEGGTTTTTEAGTTAKQPPNPILPVGKEMLWAFGTFMVLFLLMRFLLFPRLKSGMDARYGHIRGQLDAAESLRASAEAEAARYQAQLAAVRAEANSRIEAARHQLEAERQERLTAVNASIGSQRAQAAQQVDDARQAALAHVEQAVSEVAANLAERAIGAPVDPAVARDAAAEVVRAGVGS